jgi:hypothetical protein
MTMIKEGHTFNPGVSIPAVTTRLERTKHDIRNGRKTGSPVSITENAFSDVKATRYRCAKLKHYRDVL